MARYCDSCGTPAEEGAAFCDACGAPLPALKQSSPGPAPTHPLASRQAAAAPEARRRKPLLLIGLGLAVAAVITVVLALVLPSGPTDGSAGSGDHEPRTATATPTASASPSHSPIVVTIVAPTIDDQAFSGESLEILVEVVPDGAVESVRILLDGIQLGRPLTGAPYSVSWMPDDAGDYEVVAEAVDDAGAGTLSEPLLISVSERPVTPTPAASETDTARAEADIRSMIERWRAAREALDFPTYMGFYSPDFASADGMDYDEWYANKRRIYRTTAAPVIELSNLRVMVDPDGAGARVSVHQTYAAAGLNSEMTKRLGLRLEHGLWLIVSENQ